MKEGEITQGEKKIPDIIDNNLKEECAGKKYLCVDIRGEMSSLQIIEL